MPKVEINGSAILQTLIVALLVAISGAAFSTYVEVRMLRRDVDRLEAQVKEMRIDVDRTAVYVDQLWKQPVKR